MYTTLLVEWRQDYVYNYNTLESNKECLWSSCENAALTLKLWLRITITSSDNFNSIKFMLHPRAHHKYILTPIIAKFKTVLSKS